MAKSDYRAKRVKINTEVLKASGLPVVFNTAQDMAYIGSDAHRDKPWCEFYLGRDGYRVTRPNPGRKRHATAEEFVAWWNEQGPPEDVVTIRDIEAVSNLLEYRRHQHEEGDKVAIEFVPIDVDGVLMERGRTSLDACPDRLIIHVVGYPKSVKHYPYCAQRVKVRLSSVQCLPTKLEAVLSMVRELVRDYELHEVDEWLRFAGTHVNDPHAADRDAIGEK